MPSLTYSLIAALAATGLAAPVQEREVLGQSFSIPRVAIANPRVALSPAEHKARVLAKYNIPVPQELKSLADSHKVQAYAKFADAVQLKKKKHSSTRHSTSTTSARHSSTTVSTTTRHSGSTTTQRSSSTSTSVPSSTTATGAAPTPTGGLSGSDPAIAQQDDVSYLCPVTVGTTEMMLDFDTGSSDLWVFSTLQPSSQIGSHTTYNPSASGKKLSGASWKISYGDQSGASGVVYTDNVQIGPISVTSQAVEAATSVSTQFVKDTNNDGLVGFAFSSINTVTPKKQLTWFDNIASSLASPLVAAAFKTEADNAAGAGVYDIGFLNSSNYQGDITYLPVDSSQGFWQVGGTSGGILDTGTTLMYYDDALVKAYYANVAGAKSDTQAGGYTFPCSSASELQPFTFTIGDFSTSVEAKYINMGAADNTGTSCFGGLQSNTGIGLSIFGDVYLKGKYVVFENDGSSPRAGIAWQQGHPLSG